jgi:hypothetical protein
LIHYSFIGVWLLAHTLDNARFNLLVTRIYATRVVQEASIGGATSASGIGGVAMSDSKSSGGVTAAATRVESLCGPFMIARKGVVADTPHTFAAQTKPQQMCSSPTCELYDRGQWAQRVDWVGLDETGWWPLRLRRIPSGQIAAGHKEQPRKLDNAQIQIALWALTFRGPPHDIISASLATPIQFDDDTVCRSRSWKLFESASAVLRDSSCFALVILHMRHSRHNPPPLTSTLIPFSNNPKAPPHSITTTRSLPSMPMKNQQTNEDTKEKISASLQALKRANAINIESNTCLYLSPIRHSI